MKCARLKKVVTEELWAGRNEPHLFITYGLWILCLLPQYLHLHQKAVLILMWLAKKNAQFVRVIALTLFFYWSKLRYASRSKPYDIFLVCENWCRTPTNYLSTSPVLGYSIHSDRYEGKKRLLLLLTRTCDDRDFQNVNRKLRTTLDITNHMKCRPNFQGHGSNIQYALFYQLWARFGSLFPHRTGWMSGIFIRGSDA